MADRLGKCASRERSATSRSREWRERDDERVIEVRPDGVEQIIQAQFKTEASGNSLTPSQGGSLDSRKGSSSDLPPVVMCTRCHARFAAGAKFCGRCGNTTFQPAEVMRLPDTGTAQTISCPRCHSKYASHIKFCGRCGIPIGAAVLDWRAPRSVEVVCITCGTSYPATTKFCGRCGRPVKGL